MQFQEEKNPSLKHSPRLLILLIQFLIPLLSLFVNKSNGEKMVYQTKLNVQDSSVNLKEHVLDL